MLTKDDSVLMHFRPEERPFVERCFDWANRAAERCSLVLTPFLDPREQAILKAVAGRIPDLAVHLDGGWEDAERMRAIVAPDYMPIDAVDFGLAYLRIESANRKKLEHPDVLGALIGLGIKREKLGDINICGDQCDIIVASELYDYLYLLVGQIGRERVTIKKIVRDEVVRPDQKATVRTVSVASMRLDAILSEGFRISRTKASTLIKNGKCKLNWKTIDKPDEQVEPGDMISLRGFGRMRVESFEGISKKGRKWMKILSYE